MKSDFKKFVDNDDNFMKHSWHYRFGNNKWFLKNEEIHALCQFVNHAQYFNFHMNQFLYVVLFCNLKS
jgi:hypothetical protein